MSRGYQRYQTGKHLEAFILLVISHQPMHGGAVLVHLRSILPPVWTIDDGQVYRLLRSLEADKALESTWVTEAESAPVRVYRITEAGLKRLVEWKEEIEVRIQSLRTFLDLWSQPTDGSASLSDTTGTRTAERPGAGAGRGSMPTRAR